MPLWALEQLVSCCFLLLLLLWMLFSTLHDECLAQLIRVVPGARCRLTDRRVLSLTLQPKRGCRRGPPPAQLHPAHFWPARVQDLMLLVASLTSPASEGCDMARTALPSPAGVPVAR